MRVELICLPWQHCSFPDLISYRLNSICLECQRPRVLSYFQTATDNSLMIYLFELNRAVLFGGMQLQQRGINPLNAELNPVCHLLALLGVHYFIHVSRISVKSLSLRLLMSYTYMEHPFLMFLDHTQ